MQHDEENRSFPRMRPHFKANMKDFDNRRASASQMGFYLSLVQHTLKKSYHCYIALGAIEMEREIWFEMLEAGKRLLAAQRIEEFCLDQYRRDRTEESLKAWVHAGELVTALSNAYRALRADYQPESDY